MFSRRMLWYTGLWTTVIAVSLCGSYFNSILLDQPFHLRQELPFTARWLAWLALTPLAVKLAKKMYFPDSKWPGFLAYHFSIYLLLCAIHIFAASLMAWSINSALGQHAVYAAILRKCALTGVFFNFVVYTIMLLVINGEQHYKALQAEKIKTLTLEKSLTENRLQFLKQQLQPHFLFNAHHSIITLIRLGEKEKAAEMLDKLSGLMRVALREAEEHKTTLTKEIETLQLYIDIQKTRFEDRMNVVYSIEDDALQALAPSMILQPLVENSIKYAVERAASPCSINISAAKTGERLTLSVKDASTGPRPSDKIKKGAGLTNSEERLLRLYGTASTFAINPYTQAGLSGMEVTMTIPLEYAAV